jgi:hypothetical protein
MLFGYWSYPIAKILYITYAELSLFGVSLRRLLLDSIVEITQNTQNTKLTEE